jgi:hypothetical protein
MLTLVFGAPAWSDVEASARITTRWCDDAGRAFAVGRTAGDERWIDWSGLGTFHFRSASSSVHFRPVPGVEPGYATDVFARVVQPLILQAQGLPVLHGSAVIGPGGAIVFCGVSGTGKSTVAYAMGARPDFRQIADDAVVMRDDGRGGFEMVPIAFRPRLRASAAGYFGVSASPTVAPPAPCSGGVPLNAVILLSQDAPASAAEPPRLSRTPPASAFSAILTHAHCFDETDRLSVSHMVNTYLSIAATVPVFCLTYRPDFSAIEQLAETIVEGVAQFATP